jgi:nucleoside-diphosphate-sugar epimerase
MRVLLTGATGYIGRRLSQRLADEDLDLRLFVRDPRKRNPSEGQLKVLMLLIT